MVEDLVKTAEAMVVRSKGILAADESTGTIKRRFDSINLENTEQNRRLWRQILLTTPDIGDYISGVILFEETLYQRSDTGRLFPEILAEKGIIPGVKVDKSTHPLASAEGEVVTDGLDGLRGRLRDYRKSGAKFTKWRAVISIGEGKPTSYCINVNAHALARYATLSQEEGLVPIVEPEVLMDGTHSINRCFEVTENVLHQVFNELIYQRAVLEAMVLKPNMVLSGKKADNKAPAMEVAQATMRCFLRSVPAAIPGIAFLSGGQNDHEATQNLYEINKLANKINPPWELTYSYGRGLQASPLKVWLGKPENILAAQRIFQERGRAISLARQGRS